MKIYSRVFEMFEKGHDGCEVKIKITFSLCL